MSNQDRIHYEVEQTNEINRFTNHVTGVVFSVSPVGDEITIEVSKEGVSYTGRLADAPTTLRWIIENIEPIGVLSDSRKSEKPQEWVLGWLLSTFLRDRAENGDIRHDDLVSFVRKNYPEQLKVPTAGVAFSPPFWPHCVQCGTALERGLLGRNAADEYRCTSCGISFSFAPYEQWVSYAVGVDVTDRVVSFALKSSITN